MSWLSQKHDHWRRDGALGFTVRTLWRLPARFELARILGPFYSLRCLVFHDISTTESPFTRGMGVTVAPAALERALAFIRRYYIPVHLDEVLADRNGGLPPRAMLVTFDDGYASAMDWAAPLCTQYGIPAVFFLNAAFLGNKRLAPDNLVCYVANVLGMDAINSAAKRAAGSGAPRLRALDDVFARFLPAISLDTRRVFLDALLDLGRIRECELAETAGLYLSPKNVAELAGSGFAIGNHTYTHVHCRALSSQDSEEEIDRNKAELEALTGKKVRSFSLPYGSSADLTRAVMERVIGSGHEAVFLSESVANPRRRGQFGFDRVSARAEGDESLFFEIEVLPRLRARRNQLRSFSFPPAGTPWGANAVRAEAVDHRPC